MPLMLDATGIQDESELTQETASADPTDPAGQIDQPPPAEAACEEAAEQPPAAAVPIHTIALDLPDEYETAIVLLISKESDGLYRSGYSIARGYESSPQEKSGEKLPAWDDAEDMCVETLGEAVVDAGDAASWWLSTHSDDNDEKASMAREALKSWLNEFEPETATKSIFDDATVSVGEAIETIDGKPIPPASVEEVQPVYEDRCPACNSTPADTSVVPETDAEKDHRIHCHELAWEIATNHIELAKAKATVKRLNKMIESAVAELEAAEEEGPEELPLFNQPKIPAIAAEKPTETVILPAEPVADVPAPAPTEEAPKAEDKPVEQDTNTDVAIDAEPWRAVTIEAVGIDPKICLILRESQDKPITTLGEISDWCDDFSLTDLKKIGQAKADKIEAAMDKYWEASPRE